MLSGIFQGVMERGIFVVLPYAALAIFLIGLGVRSARRTLLPWRLPPEYLADPAHFLGLLALQAGLLPLVMGDLVILAAPRLVQALTRQAPLLYLLELGGLALSLLVVVGALQVLLRRASDLRIRGTSTAPEWAALVLLLVLGLTGTHLALFDGWMTGWMPVVFPPYALSLLQCQPYLDAVLKLPAVAKLHLAAAFALLALAPFSRTLSLLFAPGYYLWKRPGEVPRPTQANETGGPS